MIMHIDMDAFFASIEQAINPRLKGKPLIVGSRPNRLYTVVSAASYEAKAMGIHSGMPSKEAFKLCPGLEFVASDQSKYIWTSEEILKMLRPYGFETNYASIDEFQLDIGSCSAPEKLAQDIQRQIQEIFHISASIGIAKNCLLSKLASKLNKPNGITVITEENLTAILDKTPVEKLCGIGESSKTILHNLGVNSCLDLYRKSPVFLESVFGQNGANLYLGLHSVESLTLSQDESRPKSIGHSYTLARASQNPGFIRAWIRLLSEMVATRLRKNNFVAGTVHLWLNMPESGNFGAQRTFQQATNDSYEVYQRCLKIMAKTGLKTPKVRALGVTCSSLSRSSEYLPLFKEQKRREDLLSSIDRINGRFGENTIYPAVITLTRNRQ